MKVYIAYRYYDSRILGVYTTREGAWQKAKRAIPVGCVETLKGCGTVLEFRIKGDLVDAVINSLIK